MDTYELAEWITQQYAETEALIRESVTGPDEFLEEMTRDLEAELGSKRRILAECVRTLQHEDHGYMLAEFVIEALAEPLKRAEDRRPQVADLLEDRPVQLTVEYAQEG